jgi:hypothetical protein
LAISASSLALAVGSSIESSVNPGTTAIAPVLRHGWQRFSSRREQKSAATRSLRALDHELA